MENSKMVGFLDLLYIVFIGFFLGLFSYFDYSCSLMSKNDGKTTKISVLYYNVSVADAIFKKIIKN